jgi:hypothetical protein
MGSTTGISFDLDYLGVFKFIFETAAYLEPRGGQPRGRAVLQNFAKYQIIARENVDDIFQHSYASIPDMDERG